MNALKTLLLVVTFFTWTNLFAETTSSTETAPESVTETAPSSETDTKTNEESDLADADKKLLVIPKEVENAASTPEATPPSEEAEEEEDEYDDDEPDADDC